MASRLQNRIVRIVLAIASECWGKFLFSCFNLPGVLTLQKFFLPRPCRGAGERFNEPGGAPASRHRRKNHSRKNDRQKVALLAANKNVLPAATQTACLATGLSSPSPKRPKITAARRLICSVDAKSCCLPPPNLTAGAKIALSFG
jgi:hypothetical protein